MEDNRSMEVFAKAPIRKEVLQNALPAMAAMLMVLILACGKFLFNDLDLGTVPRSDRTNFVMCCMALLSLLHFAPKSNHKRPDYIFHSLAKDQHFYIHGGISKPPCPITAALVSGRSE